MELNENCSARALEKFAVAMTTIYQQLRLYVVTELRPYKSLLASLQTDTLPCTKKITKLYKMKKLLLVVAAAAAGFAFGYFAWKYYKGEKGKDKEDDDDGSDTVSRNEKIYSQKKNFG